MSIALSPTPSFAARQQNGRTSETLSQVQTLTQRIQAVLRPQQKGGHVVGVTSCSRQEGVSTVAENLATCAADIYSGCVLLVDANPQHASVAKNFSIPVDHPGLVQCVTGQSPIHECLAQTQHPRLNVLPTGTRSEGAVGFPEDHVAKTFGDLRTAFSLIVVDLPPANEMDQMVMASESIDGVLLVIEAERVRRHVAQQAQRRIEQTETTLLGVVLNKRKNHIPEWVYRRL